MIYRLEQHSGMIYTEDEFVSNYASMLEKSMLLSIFNEMPVIEVPEGKLEEIRNKLLYIYSQPIVEGSIIAECYSSPDKWFVYDASDIRAALVENCNNPVERKRWVGPYVTIVGGVRGNTMVDQLKPLQVLYNTATNKLNGKTI